MWAEIGILLRKEFVLELRRKSVISGIALYLLSLVFICYITFSLRHNAINAATWSALFWLTILFSVVNTVAKSFIGEKRGVTIYYYSIAGPDRIIVAKILYNTILCFLLSLAGYALFGVFIDNPVHDKTIFLTALLLTSIGFSGALTLISGIASRANNSNILMAVLSFPILIGILLMAIRITKNVVDDLDPSVSYDELLNLLAIDGILVALAFVLFPYVWRS